MSLVRGGEARKSGPLRADAEMVDEIWDGTKRNRGKNFRGPCTWGWGRDGALRDMGESQECCRRCHRRDVVGQYSSNPVLEVPTLHNQETDEDPGGRSREKTCSGYLRYDEHRKGSHSEEGPLAGRATVPTVRLM